MRRKEYQIFTSSVYSSYQAGISPEGGLTRNGTILVIFLEALCVQTNLLWHKMKINKMYTET